MKSGLILINKVIIIMFWAHLKHKTLCVQRIIILALLINNLKSVYKNIFKLLIKYNLD